MPRLALIATAFISKPFISSIKVFAFTPSRSSSIRTNNYKTFKASLMSSPKIKGPKGGNKAPIFDIPVKDRLFTAEDGLLLKDVTCFSFYHFAPIKDPDVAAQTFHKQLKDDSLITFAGTCYLATEGMNAQFSVVTSHMPQFENVLRAAADGVFGDSKGEHELDINIGETLLVGTPAPFKRFRVVSRPQILTDGLDQSYEWSDPGPEIEPEVWHNELVQAKASEKQPLILDCRNDYESNIGAFDGAVPLNTKTFAETWDVLDKMVEDKPKDETIYAYCTGGIRCVKVGAYLKQKHGLKDVRRLRHGTIAYEKWAKRSKKNSIGAEEDVGDSDKSETVQPSSTPSAQDSLFLGTNFIFDQRPLEGFTPDEETQMEIKK